MNACEEGPFKAIGTLGVSMFHRWRAAVLGFMSFLMFISIILAGVAYAGSSLNTNVVSGTSWTMIIDTNNDDNNHDSVFAYYGLREVFFPSHSGSDDFDGVYLEYSSCANDDYSDICQDCYYAGKKAMTGAGFAIFFAIVLFILNCTRICVDRVLFKTTVLVFAFMQFICTASIMGVWNNECASKLEVPTDDYVLSVGAGYASIAVVFAFNFISAIFNLLTPTKDPLPITTDGAQTVVSPAGVVVNSPVAAPGVVTGVVVGQAQPVYAQQPPPPAMPQVQPVYGQQPVYAAQTTSPATYAATGTPTAYGAPVYGAPPPPNKV